MTTAPEAPTVITIPTDEHSVALERAIEAIRAGAENRLGHIRGYLNVLSSGMEVLRIDHESVEGDYDEAVVASIESFIPRLAQFTEFLSEITQYEADENYADVLHKFFEDLIPYLYDSNKFILDYHAVEGDTFKFIIHELFLYTIAILLKEEKFETANHLISNKYHAEYNARQGKEPMVPYFVFCHYIKSINVTRNNRLKLNLYSPQTEVLKSRAELLEFSFSHLMQADFVLVMRDELNQSNPYGFPWWPMTLFHANSIFEMFARAESIRYFDRIKCLLNIATKEDMDTLFEAYASGERQFVRWDFERPSPRTLMGFEKLATTTP